MRKIHCLNPISEKGLSRLTADYVRSDTPEDAEALLVRSADMHGMTLPKGLLAVARAGAGVNNIPCDELA